MSPRRDSTSLLDIVETCQTSASLIDGMDKETFLADLHGQARPSRAKQSRWAIPSGVTVRGEATKRLSRASQAGHPTVPWRRVAGMRDILVHDYEAVDLEEVRRVVTTDVPAFLGVDEPLLGGAD